MGRRGPLAVLRCKRLSPLVAAASAFMVMTASSAWAVKSVSATASNTFDPKVVQIARGVTVEWNFDQAISPHTVTDDTGLNLFDSETKPPQSDPYSFQFRAAGTYAYVCEIHRSIGMAGTVKVTVGAAPTSGGLSTKFRITWASAAPGSGLNVDVQIKRPGASAFQAWKTNQTTALSALFDPTVKGIHRFRARLQRGTGAFSAWSPIRIITVN